MMLSLGLLTVSIACSVTAQTLQWCGSQQYNPMQYTCYNNELLCPFLDGAPTLDCGQGCYDPNVYNCNNGALTQLAPDNNPFYLLGNNPSALAESLIQACGRYFWIQNGGPCTYCPALPDTATCPPGDFTVIYAGGGMDTEVPGGQTLYVEPSGALGFTQAHSAEIPPGAVVGGFSAFQNGAFLFSGASANGGGWLACPATAEQQGAGQMYQIFAQLPQVTFPSGCLEIEILTVDYQGQGPAAWQYE